MIAPLVALFPPTWPEPLRKAAAWAAVALAVLALLWSAKAIYDANVIADHEKNRAVESMDAHDDAAEARASDAIANDQLERERNEAIDQAQDSAPSDADRLLNCKRLRDLGRVPAGC